MNRIARFIAAVALIGGPAAPILAAQDEGHVEAQGVIGDVIEKLIANRYKVSERDAIRRCGWAAVDKAENQYRAYFKGPPKAYPGYKGYVRVAAITDVERRTKGVRVRGLLDTARYGYRDGRYGADLSFRCDTDRKGKVSDVRLDRNPWYRPR